MFSGSQRWEFFFFSFLEGVEGSDVLPRLQCDFSVRLLDFKCDWCILSEWGEWGIITQLPGRGGAAVQRDGGSGFVRRLSA